MRRRCLDRCADYTLDHGLKYDHGVQELVALEFLRQLHLVEMSSREAMCSSGRSKSSVKYESFENQCISLYTERLVMSFYEFKTISFNTSIGLFRNFVEEVGILLAKLHARKNDR